MDNNDNFLRIGVALLFFGGGVSAISGDATSTSVCVCSAWILMALDRISNQINAKD